MIEKILKRINDYLGYRGDEKLPDYLEKEIEYHLTSFEQNIREENKKTISDLYEKLQGVEDTHIRLGDLSAWKNYGKKYKYWDYFEKTTKEEFFKEMPNRLELNNYNEHYSTGYIQCWEDVKKLNGNITPPKTA
jgi:5-hydroxyisourate hydrolase-like protein (transthyretin family)